MAFEEVGVRAVVQGMSGYMSDIDAIERKTAGLGSKMGSIGQSMIGAGAKLTAGLTLPLVGAAAAVLKLGLGFENEMTNIATLTNIPKESIGTLRDSIFEISEATAKSPDELGAAAYFVLSAGFDDAADAANILAIAAQQAALGMGSTETTVRPLAGLLQAYGKGSEEAAKFGDMMTASVKVGAAEASEMAGAFANVVPFAAQLGVGFDVIGGTLAQMTNKTYSADEAATSLNQLFVQLISPSDELKDTLEAMGFTVEGLLAGLKTDAVGTLTSLSQRAEESGKTVTLFADNVRAARGFVAAFGENAGDTAELIKQVGDSTGTTSESFKTLQESAGFKLSKAMNDLKLVLTDIGISVLPLFTQGLAMVTPLIDKLGLLVDFFEQLPGPVQAVIGGFLGLVAAIGPLLTIAGVFVTGLGGLVTVLGLLLSPIGLVVLAVAGVVAGLVDRKSTR